MNVFRILDNVKEYTKGEFKIGFVGNGEGFLDWPHLKSYIRYLENAPQISTYTITNGTVSLPDEEIRFLEEHEANIGFSIDGFKELHDRNRCGSFDKAMENVEQYHRVTGHYPTFNATVGRESIDHIDEVITFFERFGTRVTFSRMIGKFGISLEEYRQFVAQAEKRIPVRTGGQDCTMYNGLCGAGINNYYFANGKVYYCGNCVDLPPIAESNISFFELEMQALDFDRTKCYKETLV